MPATDLSGRCGKLTSSAERFSPRSGPGCPSSSQPRRSARVRQVLLSHSLLSNAINYNHPAGKVITENGRGTAGNDLGRLFTPLRTAVDALGPLARAAAAGSRWALALR